MARRDSSPGYRVFLSALGAVLLSGCAYLSIGIRAVPARDLWVLLGALLYGTVFTIALAPAQRPAPASWISPVKPLAGYGVMRLQATVLLCVSGAVSIAVPWTWILAGKLSRRQVEMLAPHLFMMMSQVIFELACYRPTFSVLVRVSVPVLFSAYRLRLLLEWLAKADQVLLTTIPPPSNALAVRYLALANLSFWIFVLFYFLLLKVVPLYFLETTATSKTSEENALKAY